MCTRQDIGRSGSFKTSTQENTKLPKEHLDAFGPMTARAWKLLVIELALLGCWSSGKTPHGFDISSTTLAAIAKSFSELGATRQELDETLGVALLRCCGVAVYGVGGGPSLMHAAHAIAAFEKFFRLPPR